MCCSHPEGRIYFSQIQRMSFRIVRTYHSFIRPLLAGALLVVLATPFAASAQSTTPEIVPADTDEALLLEHLSSRGDCLTEYNFGNIALDFGTWEETGSGALTAGETLRVPGTLLNRNSYPLADGRLFARVLRHDPAVADENWHPIVAETFVPGDFSLAANGQKSFDFTWPVPANAPAGIYAVEFSYLAGNRYVMAGIPYVSNFSAGSVVFEIDPAASATPLVEFDRSSVTINQKALALRAVPPSLPAQQPVTVAVSLNNSGASPVTTTVDTALYAWSDTDPKAPLVHTTQQVTVGGGASQAIPFVWEQPQPGVHELVLKTTPADPAILPSIIKVRFPIEGNVPRIIFSGVTDLTTDQVLVTTCAVNGTVGSGVGSIETAVLSNGQTLGSSTGVTNSAQLGSVQVIIPVANLGTTLDVQTVLKNEQGVITDTNTTTYTRELLFGPNAQAAPTPATPRTNNQLWLIGIGVAIVLIGGVTMLLYRHRRPTLNNPPPHEPPQV